MTDSYEQRTLAFVISIWLEEYPRAGQPPHWRGYITHVMSGQRRHFQDLSSLTSFIESYLAQWLDEGETE